MNKNIIYSTGLIILLVGIGIFLVKNSAKTNKNSFKFNEPITETITANNIEKELSRIKSKYALLIQSQGIDEFPVWSKDGENVYINEEGQWKRILLSQVKLNPSTWRDGILIGVNNNEKSVTIDLITQTELDTLLSNTLHDARDLTLSNGTRIQLKQELFSTLLKITVPGKETTTEWATDMENCHGLVASPNQKYVLFKCELNGVFLMKI